MFEGLTAVIVFFSAGYAVSVQGEEQACFHSGSVYARSSCTHFLPPPCIFAVLKLTLRCGKHYPSRSKKFRHLPISLKGIVSRQIKPATFIEALSSIFICETTSLFPDPSEDGEGGPSMT